VLEFCAQPHAILREAERVLMPEGSAVISGFNPLSLWGAARALGWERRRYPGCGRYIGLLRLKDWLALLGFELNGGRFGRYAPPFSQGRWLERFGFMEKAGERWWPICGSVYVVRAVKRVAGMRLVTPAWRDRRVAKKSLAPVTQRENGLHVEKRERR
jgi:SAM-dependent methyltransferase